jgi:hypothetical protein
MNAKNTIKGEANMSKFRMARLTNWRTLNDLKHPVKIVPSERYPEDMVKFNGKSWKVSKDEEGNFFYSRMVYGVMLQGKARRRVQTKKMLTYIEYADDIQEWTEEA